ncbi:class I SAM-dependent methyltransferase [Asanoa siamensis]|uniref:Methyltransferase family protein n=1 Tax=Asanoa siamensis TaxID=926357 RepID=A0ABQ4CZ25_9ACTN|nr:class I SAM-dependent methyltransferase [Asanoa siamensis]GIF76535.1 hypothetical protein Asi02nite_60530 [Asanoa siamensis]
MEKRPAGRVFGEVAEDYDRVRLPFPAALVDDVLGYSHLAGPALEVGAGTGRATVAFAERGVPVVAVEPDAAMAAGGTPALFWHNERVADPSMRQAMLDVYASHAPAVTVHDDPLGPGDVRHRWPGSELAEVAAFGSLASQHYRSDRTVWKADYLGLAQTRSQFRMLPGLLRDAVLADLAGVFADEVPLTIDTTLVLATRR